MAFDRYAAALLFITLALLATAAVSQFTEHSPFLLPLSAVIAAGWLCGARPALVAAGVATAAIAGLWLPVTEDVQHLAPLTVFATVSSIVAVQTGAWRSAVNGLRSSNTRYKALATDLENANELLKAVIDASPVAIVGLEADGTVRIWNRAAKDMFGWDTTEVLGHLNPIVPADREAEYHSFIAALQQGRVLNGVQTKRQRKDGTVVDVNLWTRGVAARDGGSPLSVALLADLTEHKRLEAQFVQAQKMEAVGRLAGGIAHDFNNLLTTILGYCDLTLDKSLDEETRSDVEEVQKAATSAASLTSQLLAFSRRQIMQPVIFDLGSRVVDCRKMLGRLIGEDIEIVLSMPAAPVCVKADPGQFEQVLFNLVVNARDAMPHGGVLRIELTEHEVDSSAGDHDGVVTPGRYAVLAVSDTGVGMTPEVQRRLFEPFFTTKEQGKGTGLGLATTYGIVKQSGGYVGVYSEVGVGSTMKVYLPLSPVAADPPSPAITHDAPTGSETVLLVEDDAAVRELARRALRRHGYRTLCAGAADEALAIARHSGDEINLLLTDMVMPGMNGRALAEQLLTENPHLRVLYMSGYTDDAVVNRGLLDAGAAFLQKPFTSAALARRVREVLSP